jgi:hypothetical protein
MGQGARQIHSGMKPLTLRALLQTRTYELRSGQKLDSRPGYAKITRSERSACGVLEMTEEDASAR